MSRLRSGAGDYSPLTGYPLVLLDLSGMDDCALADQYDMLQALLPSLSCPVIAIAPPGLHTAVAGAADTVVTSQREARVLAGNILQHPLSAMTLVQLLRHNERSSPEDGLLAESLAYATLQGGAEFRHYLATRPACPRPATTREPVVLVERREDLLVLTLNRPEQRNAYSTAMRDALYEGLQLQATDNTLSRTIIRGAGACFCTGGALEEFGLAEDTSSAHAVRCARHVGRLMAALSEKIECQLHGACIGSGIELPAFAGRVIARRNTYFHLPEITMGLIPGAGGTVSMLRRIGRQRLAYLALSAKRINAKTALEWGLVDGLSD